MGLSRLRFPGPLHFLVAGEAEEPALPAIAAARDKR
jgi:hypothetical protein